MNVSIFVLIVVGILVLICILIAIYFQIYKKHINKALLKKDGKNIQMLPPYKLILALMAFFISLVITATSVVGLFYSKEYFEYEKDTIKNMSARTVYVNNVFCAGTARNVSVTDVDNINSILEEAFTINRNEVIPVYTACGGLSMNGCSLNLFAIDKKYCNYIGLDEMSDGTLYLANSQNEDIVLDISVTEIVDGGFVSNDLEHLTLSTKSGIAENSLVMTNSVTPGMKNVGFVNMETFFEITSLLIDSKIENEQDFIEYEDLVKLEGIYICANNLSGINSVNSILSFNNYNAYTPIDTFRNFENTVSNLFIVFLLSSVILLLLTVINIFLSVNVARRMRK